MTKTHDLLTGPPTSEPKFSLEQGTGWTGLVAGGAAAGEGQTGPNLNMFAGRVLPL